MAIDPVITAQQDYNAWQASKDAATERAQVQVKYDENGNAYTSNVSNDSLTSNDFLRLMIEELKMQDPTKPMDTDRMMESQLKMSTIDTNVKMAESLEALTKAYKTSSVASAVSLMGRTIENGSVNEQTGMISAFKVQTIESLNGEVYVNAKEALGFVNPIMKMDVDENGLPISSEPLHYDEKGRLLNEDNERTGVSVKLTSLGKIDMDEDGYIFYDEAGERITDEDILRQYTVMSPQTIYSDTTTPIPINDITKVI